MPLTRTCTSRVNPLLTALFVCCFAIASAFAAPDVSSASDPAITLSQQVWALQTLHDLDLDAAQFDALKAAIPTLDADPVPHPRSKVSAKYLAKLQSLRDVMIRETDYDETGDQIDDLRDDLDDLRDTDDVEIDDRVRIADGARAKTADVMKLLKPSQVASYIAAYQDEVPDPVQLLISAADSARGMDAAKFAALSEQTSTDISILLAGLDKEKAARVAARITDWLKTSRALTDAQYKAAQSGQETSAKQALGDIDSFDIIRHWVERDIAELLSNPQLGNVIDERLKHMRKS